jgi:GNAT superfamily N-acetyltransferase
VRLRRARAADEPAIARLHADSWRAAYRGILGDDFLDNTVVANRRELWRTRFSEIDREDQLILVGEEHGEIQAFACAFLDADPEWGTLLDNLHVLPGLKGRGLGRQLISAVVSDCVDEAAPDGSHVNVLRYGWRELSLLVKR